MALLHDRGTNQIFQLFLNGRYNLTRYLAYFSVVFNWKSWITKLNRISRSHKWAQTGVDSLISRAYLRITSFSRAHTFHISNYARRYRITDTRQFRIWNWMHTSRRTGGFKLITVFNAIPFIIQMQLALMSSDCEMAVEQWYGPVSNK